MAFLLAAPPLLGGLVTVPWWPTFWWLWAVAAGLVVVGLAAERGAARTRARSVADIRDIADLNGRGDASAGHWVDGGV